ncbi:MAG: flippase-like domain-containing protein [Corallococcus sp.]|nr:flippase-like domain-containing protein [Corallococcus sp.]MCM1360076.1 flippase-like domain-containing protein [Corallococcus sp.]MCM1395633.1 flippase-like domain-containing protein [Corallococcus sp.]
MPNDKPTTENTAVDTEPKVKYAEAMDNFSKKEVPQQVQKKKHRWIGPVVLLLAIGIGVYFIVDMALGVAEDQKIGFAEAFGSVTWQNGLIALAVVLGVMLLDMVKFAIVLHATTRKVHPLISAKTSLLGKYYDAITPFATGGQPMQIYYLHKKGLSGGTSTAVVLIKYTFNTIAALLVGLVCMACNTGVSDNKWIIIVGWIGWALNACLPLFLMLFIIMPKLAKKLTQGFVHVGYKLRIVKDKEKVMQKAQNAVQDFRSAFIIMSKHPFHLIVLVLTCALEMALTFAVPFFIIRMFNGMPANNQSVAEQLFSIMALNAYVSLGASIVPTPGSSGALEGLMRIAFAELAGLFVWVMFTWRFSVFYVYILIGVGITVFNFIRNIVRQKRAAKLGVSVAEMLGEGPLPSTFDEVPSDQDGFVEHGGKQSETATPTEGAEQSSQDERGGNENLSDDGNSD